MINTQGIPSNPRLLNIKGASNYTGLPVWAIRNLVWNQKIPFIKIGTKYYLDVKDIESWIKKNKQG